MCPINTSNRLAKAGVKTEQIVFCGVGSIKKTNSSSKNCVSTSKEKNRSVVNILVCDIRNMKKKIIVPHINYALKKGGGVIKCYYYKKG